MNRIKQILFFFPAVFLLLILAGALTGCVEKIPVIDSIDPRIGNMGDDLTINGAHFGKDQNESYITIAGAPPTLSSYKEWSDDKIVLTIPEFAEPGLIYVHREGRISNPVLFANRATIPATVQTDELYYEPRITSVEPKSAAIGSLITITGVNFGTSRENSGVWFAWDAESAPSAPADRRTADGVEVFDTEFGYDLWSEREIRVRVPDGAVSGNIEIRTPRGNSRPIYYEITGKPGTKTFKDKRSYTLSYSADIKVQDAAIPNSLYIWFPKPQPSAAQKNIQLLSRNTEPYVENYRGTSLYQFNDLLPGVSKQINVSQVIDVYTVETSVRAASVKDGTGPIQTVYTISSSLIPSDDSKIMAQSTAIIGREKNPYTKAKLIYDWMQKNIKIQAESMNGGALDALDEKNADNYRASLLFCALARAAGVPALPVSGILVNRVQGTTRHFWAEFWIDSFGWIPVDPALGAGAAPPDFMLRDDHLAYYFGSCDNQHIAFSRGQIMLSQMDPKGRITGRVREFSMQNIWEEATGGLESYSSLWSDVTITGVYAQ
ncbi:MAG: IPT/TIG domain-containing protein [Treponema sp.]|nr:IPT/TIG domain-containing protein [Treponema sp.]